MSASTTYGTERRLAEEGKLPKVRCGILGHDGPVLLLTWFLVMGLFLPLMLVRNIVITILGGALCFLQAFLMAMRMGRTTSSWWWYQVHSLVAFACALIVGLCLRPNFLTHQTFDDRTVGLPPRATCIQCFVIVCGTLLYTILLSWILPWLGFKCIGSSAKDEDGKSLIWRPKKAAVMDFGCARTDVYDGSFLTDDSESYPPKLCKSLLKDECFRSGEFIFDYTFHAANDHLFLGCLFSHPAHPFEKWERIIVLIVVCLLIVFPVAAFSTVMSAGILRTLLQAIVITGPRNIMKAYLMKCATKNEAKILKEHQQLHKGPLSYSTKELNILDEGFWETARIYAAIAAITFAVVLCSCYVIEMSGASWMLVLKDNMDGLMFAFYLDLVFDLVIPHESDGGVRCWGFVMRWRVAREEYLEKENRAEVEAVGNKQSSRCILS